MTQTLDAIKAWAAGRPPPVSVFVLSDRDTVAPWFESNMPEGWKVVRAGVEMEKPESGVWFGEVRISNVTPDDNYVRNAAAANTDVAGAARGQDRRRPLPRAEGQGHGGGDGRHLRARRVQRPLHPHVQQLHLEQHR